MSLPSLPLELLFHIASYLGREDLLSLCLVHRNCSCAAQSFLFKDVFLSKTKLDLAAFLGVANSPHLATIPRRLVWQELVQDEGKAIRLVEQMDARNPQSTHSYRYLPDDKISLFHIGSLLNNAFWTLPFNIAKDLDRHLPPDSASRNINYCAHIYMNDYEHGQLPAMDLSPRAVRSIHDAVKNLTSLDTIVAEPMPTRRTLAKTPDYRLTSNVMISEDDSDNEHPTDGLFLLSRECLGEQISSQIRSLQLGGTFTHPKSFAVLKKNTTLWGSLERLQIALPAEYYQTHFMRDTDAAPFVDSQVPDMVDCLRSASKLRHLVLDLDNWPIRAQDVIAEPLFGDETNWPALEYLELYSIDLSSWARTTFVARHAPTLAHIFTGECTGVDGSLVYKLAAMPELKLKSFRVRDENYATPSNNPFDDLYLVSEEKLLAFINNETVTSPINRRRRVFTTAAYRYDPLREPQLCYFDMISERQVVVPQNETFGDVPLNPVEAIAKTAANDQETDQQLSRHPKFAQRSVYTDEDRKVVAKWLAESQQIEADMEDEVPEGNDIFATPSEAASAHAKAVAAKEADKRQSRRIAERPYWRWCRQPDPSQPTPTGPSLQIYCWMTDSPEGSHRTEMWEFFREYPDGTVERGLGGDPLDCFSDWDSEIDGSKDSGEPEGKPEDAVDEEETDSRANELEPEQPEQPEQSTQSGLATEVPIGELDPDVLFARAQRLVDLDEAQWKAFRYTDALDDPRKSVRMWSRPFYYCHAFEKFLKDNKDLGYPVEEGVEMRRHSQADIPGEPYLTNTEHASVLSDDVNQKDEMDDEELAKWKSETRGEVTF